MKLNFWVLHAFQLGIFFFPIGEVDKNLSWLRMAVDVEVFTSYISNEKHSNSSYLLRYFHQHSKNLLLFSYKNSNRLILHFIHLSLATSRQPFLTPSKLLLNSLPKWLQNVFLMILMKTKSNQVTNAWELQQHLRLPRMFLFLKPIKQPSFHLFNFIKLIFA